MSLGYTNYGEMEPYNDGYSDHVCRPIIVDAEGRNNQVTRYTSGHSTQGYVVKAERIVEHIAHVAPVVGYRYVSEPVIDRNLYAQLGSSYDRPEKVEDFLTKVQTAVSQPTKVSAPFSSNWSARPNSTGQDGNANYGDDNDREFIKGSDRNKMNSNLIRDKQNEAFPQIYKGTNPMINNKDIYSSYDRPRGNEGGIVPGRPLSKPTNNIGSAVEVLTESVKPMYGTNSQTDASRPIKASPLSSIHWRTGSNLAAQDRKVDSDDDDDREKAMEQQMYRRDRIPNYREPTNRINNKEGHERPNGNGSATYFKKPAAFQTPSEQPRFSTAPAMQNKETYSSPETIDSSEARKRYGKLKSQPVPEDAYIGTIDSNDVLKKYNGTKVPW